VGFVERERHDELLGEGSMVSVVVEKSAPAPAGLASGGCRWTPR
jgi:hypothetical protein